MFYVENRLISRFLFIATTSYFILRCWGKLSV